MGTGDGTPSEVEFLPVASMSGAELAEMRDLVILANADRRDLFPGPRLGPHTLEEQYGDDLAMRIRENGELVACGTVNPKEDALWVYILAVHPAKRGCGLGARLVDAAEAKASAAGKPRLRLQAVETGRLIAYYLRLGFEEEARERMPIGHWGAREPFDLVTLGKSVAGFSE